MLQIELDEHKIQLERIEQENFKRIEKEIFQKLDQIPYSGNENRNLEQFKYEKESKNFSILNYIRLRVPKTMIE